MGYGIPGKLVVPARPARAARNDSAARTRRGAPGVRSLVMWSGGLDSTYTLVRLLQETSDEVHAHHVHCTSRTNDGRRPSRRGELESYAVARMRTYLTPRYRRFHYGESRVNISAFSQAAPETTMAMFFAAHAALTLGFTPYWPGP